MPRTTRLLYLPMAVAKAEGAIIICKVVEEATNGKTIGTFHKAHKAAARAGAEARVVVMVIPRRTAVNPEV